MISQPNVKTAILATVGCKKTLKTIHYFQQKNIPAPIVIFESKIRSEYTQSQIDFKRTHLQYRSLSAKSLKSRFFYQFILLCMSIFLNLPLWFKVILSEIISFFVTPLYIFKLYQRGVQWHVVSRLSNTDTRNILVKNRVSWVFLASSQWILSSDIITDEYQIINFHPGILPYHRSLDSFFWSILYKTGVGVSAHVIDRCIDTGPVIVRFFLYGVKSDIMDLRETVNKMYPVFFFVVYMKIVSGKVAYHPQDKGVGIHHRPMTINELFETEKIFCESF